MSFREHFVIAFIIACFIFFILVLTGVISLNSRVIDEDNR